MVYAILHQGRATFDRIAAALNTHGDWERADTNLLTIEMANYAERISSLKRKINEAVQAGMFAITYDAATNRFV